MFHINFEVEYENKNSNLKFGCQIPMLNFGGHIQQRKTNVEPTELFLPSKPRFPGTLQRFDYGHSGHEKSG